MRFSQEEWRHLGLAIVVMTAAFTLLFAGGVFGLGDFSPTGLLILALASLGAVVTGFFLHEMAHKAVAQQYGCWAEFRSNPQGLMFAVFTAAIGFLFAAPGAVYIAGNVTREQNGRISLAGPLTNLAIALPCLGLGLLVPGLVGDVLFIIATVNLFLAAFNLIPFPPLDGSKVIRWNPVLWGGTLAVPVLLILWIYGVF
jgi:Zn-dependent protease